MANVILSINFVKREDYFFACSKPKPLPAMNTLQISKNRARNYLAERMARNVIDTDIEDLITVIRYNSIGGFEQFDDFDLFENLVAALPELELVFLAETDDNYLYVAVKPEHKKEEDAILVDLRKVIQVII